MNKKSKIQILVAVIALHLSATQAFAECKPIYADFIKSMDGRMNPPRTTAIASGGGTILTPIAASAIGVTVAPAALIVAPATAVVAGGYLLVTSMTKHSLMKAYKLIRDAERGSGKTLEKFFSQINANDEQTQADAIAWILEGNASNAFCPAKGELEISKPLNYRKILRLAREEF